jgi:hypothetical protein
MGARIVMYEYEYENCTSTHTVLYSTVTGTVLTVLVR